MLFSNSYIKTSGEICLDGQTSTARHCGTILSAILTSDGSKASDILGFQLCFLSLVTLFQVGGPAPCHFSGSTAAETLYLFRLVQEERLVHDCFAN